MIFPLGTLAVAAAGARGVVLVGEAAHAFPPIGAQGLNLGLRDVADLAASLDAIDRSEAGWAQRVSTDYASRRAGDLARTGAAVDALFRSLLAGMLPAQALCRRLVGLPGFNRPALRRESFLLDVGGADGKGAAAPLKVRHSPDIVRDQFDQAATVVPCCRCRRRVRRRRAACATARRDPAAPAPAPGRLSCPCGIRRRSARPGRHRRCRNLRG